MGYTEEEKEHVTDIWCRSRVGGVHYGDCWYVRENRPCNCSANFDMGWLVGFTNRLLSDLEKSGKEVK